MSNTTSAPGNRAPAVSVAKAPPRSKMVATTMGSVINARSAVLRLTQQPVNVSTAAKFLLLKRSIARLGEEFGKKRDAITFNSKFALSQAKVQDYQVRVEKLLTEEVEIPRNVCISMADLQAVRISSNDLELLAFAILDLS